MNDLIASVEYLLNAHKCVVIPRLGAFIVQEKSAQILPSGAICAPCKEVTFNEEINHNDGILLTLWSNQLGLSINDAERLLSEEVAVFFSTLKVQGKVVFGSLGSFTSTNHGSLLFNNSQQRFFSPAYAGLENLSILPLDHAPSKQTIVLKQHKAAHPLKENSKEIKKTPSLAIRQMATIAAFVCMLIGTNHILNTNSGDSFHNASLLSGDVNALPFSNFSNFISSIKKEIGRTESQLNTNTSLSSATKTISKKQNYYVVIANYTSRRQAILDLQTIKEQFNNAAILEKDGSYKIHVGVFSEKDLAVYYLKEVRWRGIQDAFLLSAN